MMRTRRSPSTSPVLPLVAAGLSLVVLTTTASAQQETARHQLTGERVALYNIAGRVTITGGTGDAVQVEVTRLGADALDLEIATGMIGELNTLRVIYPDDRVVYPDMGRGSTTNMQVRGDGTFGGRTSGRAHRVTVTGRGRGMEAWADIRVRVPPGREFSAYIGAGEIKATNVAGDLILDTHSGSVTATGIRGSLLADTGSGSISVTDATGDVTADTGSGRVTLSNVNGRNVVVDTGSGRVTGSGVTADRLDVDTGSGSVNLDRITAQRVRVDTGSGSVDIELLADIRTLEIDTGSGGVTVWAPDDLGAEIEIDTGSGGIDIELPVDYRKHSRSYVLGQIGDGNGRIYIDTGSGGVRIRRR